MDNPKLRLIKTYSVICNQCHQHVGNTPCFLVDDYFGNDWRCPHCDCTSVLLEAGRHIGSKSKQWEWLFVLYQECYSVWKDNDELEQWKGNFVYVE